MWILCDEMAVTMLFSEIYVRSCEIDVQVGRWMSLCLEFYVLIVSDERQW